MTIRELAYELYKMDWMRRISCDIQMDTLKDYYQETTEEDREVYTFEDYVLEYGYSGQLYVGFNEFLRAEYLDELYNLTIIEQDYELTKSQKDRYIYLYEILTQNHIEIPFGVEI